MIDNKKKGKDSGLDFYAATQQFFDNALQNNSKFVFFTDQIAAYVSYINAETLRYEFINKQFCHAYGIKSRDKIIGRHMQEVLPESNYQHALQYVEEARKGKAVSYENFFVLPTQSLWLRVHYIPEFNQAGRVVSIITISYDITSYKEAELALQQSETKYRVIVETALEGILVYDCDFIITFANQKMASMLEYNVEELLGRPITDLMPNEQPRDTEAQREKRTPGQDTVYESCLLKKNGAVQWVMVSTKTLWDDEGQYNGAFAMFTDINARKEMENALRESEKKYRMFIDTAIEGVWSMDKNWQITFVNQQLASILGYTMDELVGKRYDFLFSKEQLAANRRQQQLRMQGKDSVYESRFLCKNGSEHWLLVSAKAVVDDAGNFAGSFAMLTDIHSRKLSEQDLKTLIDQLQILSNTDALTGIANRRYLDERLCFEYNRMSRSKKKMSLIMLDIDFFKNFNDCYGHVAGDVCLQQIANLLAQNLSQQAELAARYGGEEFVCMLPETEPDDALHIAKKIQSSIAALAIPHQCSPISPFVTVSMGVVSFLYFSGRKPFEYVNWADEALYKAKVAGRNRIEYFSE